MVEHALKDSKVEMAARVSQRGREKKRRKGRERDWLDIVPHSLINPGKLLKYLFLGYQECPLPLLSVLPDIMQPRFSLILNREALFFISNIHL